MTPSTPQLNCFRDANSRITAMNDKAIHFYQSRDYEAALNIFLSTLDFLRAAQSNQHHVEPQRYVCRAVTSVDLPEDFSNILFPFDTRPFVFVEGTQDDEEARASDTDSVLQVVVILYNMALTYQALAGSTNVVNRPKYLGKALSLYSLAQSAISESEEAWDFNESHHFSLFMAIGNNQTSIGFYKNEFTEVSHWLDFLVYLMYQDDHVHLLDAEEYDFYFTTGFILRESFQERLFTLAAAA